MSSILVSLASSHDNTDRATVAMVVAGAAAASGQDTTVFLSADGAWLGKTGEAEKIHEEGFAALADLITGYVEAGGKVIVCSPCANKRGITEEDLIKGAVIAGGAAVIALMADGAQTISY
ncbi:DsrE family protein [Sporichthya sp.]|uniref:DsrE family protein n=1 Tax=Sporichthya sp. TaxID=65475 RepID=UPI0017C729FE|nr:DsrE family protein [Sporichthya sp.]MBA3743840.1 DsrE family protein [Sporichthya sp.]